MARKPRLLIVEDDVLMGLELGEFLADDFEILSVVVSGEEAVDRARSACPDLILMDIRLKGDMDGIEASRLIRRDSKAPIIFITGYKDNVTMARVRDIAGAVCLNKPYDPDVLLRTIDDALRHQQ